MSTARPIARFTKRRVIAGALSVGIAGALVAAQGATAVAASSASTTPLVSVAQSSVTPLAAGTPLGTTDPSTPVDLSIILRARNLSYLQNKVLNGWTGPYLTTRQFANQYGQSPLVIAAIELYLKAFGIKTNALADGLDIQANGTAGEFNKALGVSLKNFRVKAPSAKGGTQTVYGSLANPRMPAQFASPILAILGLTNYSPFVSNAKAAIGHRVNATPAAGTGVPAGMLAPSDFVKDYNLKPLENSGYKGQGTTLAIITFAAIDPAVPVAFWNQVLGLNVPASRLKIIPIDGGAPGPSADAGTDESDLDVEQSGAIAPGANVRVYEAPNTDPGYVDSYFSAASDNVADTVSISWGGSETYLLSTILEQTESPAYLQAVDEVLAELGAQGQSNFSASGDSGAYDALDDVGTTNLVVDNISDSPFTTAAGATTLPGTQTYAVFNSTFTAIVGTESVNIPAERAWSWDYFAPLYKAAGLTSESDEVLEGGIAGDGGGYSVLEPRPSYQNGVSGFNARQYLTPTAFTQIAPGLTEPTDFSFTANPSLHSGFQGSGRAVPDVSTNGDPETGYAVYDNELFAADGDFGQYGGTSFVSPQLNGATAVIDSYVGHRVGLWNPQIYRFASKGNPPFTQLNDTTAYSGIHYLFQTNNKGVTTALPGVFSNNNFYYTGKPGSDWNPASGLGTPNLTALAKDFAK
jgi:kumamolisin